MLSRIVRLSLIFLIIALAVGVIVLNKHELSITYLPGQTTQPVMAGVVLLFTFCAGIAVTVLFSLIHGVKAYFRERAFKHRESKQQEFLQIMLEARSALASGEYDRAQDRWERLIHRDPTNIIARVELSRSIEQAGHPREALKVLDKARAVDPNNPEVLLRAADLNITLGNKTAALDNLALLVFDQPSMHAAALARDLSEELERIGDALEYHRRFCEVGGKDIEAGKRLEFKRISEVAKDEAEHLSLLRKFIKKNPEFGPALSELAAHEAKNGNIDAAADLLLKAARGLGERRYWLEAIKLWLSEDQGERAIAAARTATRNTKGEHRIQAELDLVHLHLELHQGEKARELLDNFTSLLEEEGVTSSPELTRHHLTLHGLCLNQLGDYQGASTVWEKLAQFDGATIHSGVWNKMAQNTSSNSRPKNTAAPSPTLSTP